MGTNIRRKEKSGGCRFGFCDSLGGGIFSPLLFPFSFAFVLIFITSEFSHLQHNGNKYSFEWMCLTTTFLYDTCSFVDNYTRFLVLYVVSAQFRAFKDGGSSG